MENKVVFRNPGLFDTDFLKLFGVSAKEHADPIGRFGTGLKYAIAILLREKQEVKMYVGYDTYSFYTVSEEKRGKEFDFVYMARWHNGEQREVERLPFTIALGQNWELWMAFRELYSNTIDEKGDVFLQDEEDSLYETDENETAIIVTGEAFVQVVREKEDVFLPTEPINKTSYVDIHEGTTKAVFNKGIKVGEFEKPMMNKYDITGYAYLSEDRKLQSEGWFNGQFAESITKSNDNVLIEKIVTAPREYHESTINFDRDTEPSEEFLSVVKRLIKKGKDKVNPTVVRLYENFVKKLRAEKKVVMRAYKVKVDLPEGMPSVDMEQLIYDAVYKALYEHESANEDTLVVETFTKKENDDKISF